ncbi:MAG: class I SAM-dependent methyltransferase [Clostridia bacterium]|nr:class I SAM-dependent methyltransferase [Clostridia bacterium]
MVRYYADKWDYELLDASCGERLERWGDHILIRPDPQVIWQTPKDRSLWDKAEARYVRSSSGGGSWEFYSKNLPESWRIRFGDLRFTVKPMGFKHTGVFPEQACNWVLLQELIRATPEQADVLNLFGYTGAATCACLDAGAKVVHVDASKGITAIAKENAENSKAGSSNARFFVDDCFKLVARELRRAHRYDYIILDPPSYGRGPSGEVWRVEDEIYGFVSELTGLLDGDSRAVIINSYTTGLSPAVMEYILGSVVQKKFGGYVFSSEIGIPVESSGLVLPAGGTAIWSKDKIL